MEVTISALGSFAATLALLWAVAPVPGGATAHAQGPNGTTDGANAVVGGFAPANPDAIEVRPAAAALGEVAVNARFEVREGERAIVVDFENAGRGAAEVACRVGLARMTSPAVSLMARMVPAPEREELLSESLRVRVAPGERVSRQVPVPAGLALATEPAARQRRVDSPDGEELVRASWAALSIEALDAAD